MGEIENVIEITRETTRPVVTGIFAIGKRGDRVALPTSGRGTSLKRFRCQLDWLRQEHTTTKRLQADGPNP